MTITFNEDFKKLEVRQTTKFDEIMDTIKAATKSCANLRGEPFSKCVASGVIDDITRHTDSKQQITKYRDMMSSRLRNYTCSDPALKTTEADRTYVIKIPTISGVEQHVVDVLLDLPGSKVWVVKNLITDEECEILEKHGKPRLKRATVAAEDGTSIVSENRKAQQASYNFHHNAEKDPLW